MREQLECMDVFLGKEDKPFRTSYVRTEGCGKGDTAMGYRLPYQEGQTDEAFNRQLKEQEKGINIPCHS